MISKFLIKEYLKVFLLCLAAFITLLVVTRFEEIAKLASLGADLKKTLLFALYQIPYILPIAIPLSCLISSLLLFQRLSDYHELASLRASGFSLTSLLLPLITTAALLSLFNFIIVSEIATTSHLKGRTMLYELTSQNPLILLQNAEITPLKGSYIQFSPLQNGKEAKDLLIAWGNSDGKRLNLALAQKVKIKKNQLIGENLTLISSQYAPEKSFLMIENTKECKTAAFECAKFLHGGGWRMANDHLRYSLLKVRIKKLKEERNCDTNSQVLNKCYSEVFRRFSIGLSPLTFTYLGTVFGIRVGRKISKKKVIIVTLMAALALTSIFIAKELHNFLLLSSIGFMAPHILLITLSSVVLFRISKGIEI